MRGESDDDFLNDGSEDGSHGSVSSDEEVVQLSVSILLTEYRFEMGGAHLIVVSLWWMSRTKSVISLLNQS